MGARVGGLVAAVGLVSVMTPGVAAQALGTFRWQLQPFCNVVTLSVHQVGAVYTLDGWDDQCGAGNAGSVTGTAFLNPDGTIGLGLSGATAPGAGPVMLYARVTLATVSGTWHDSAGNSGTFQFTSGPGTGGAPRPVPPNGLRPGSVTAAQIAPGAITATQIAVGTITAAQMALGSLTGAHLADGTITAAKLAPGTVQVPIVGTCPPGQYLRGVSGGGAVICEPFFVPTLTTAVESPAVGVGGYSSLAIGADGLPVISHFDDTVWGLRVTKCGNAACTAGNVSTTIDGPSPLVGEFTSIAIGADGFPVISHYDSTNSGLRVTKCGNAACTAGNVSTTVDSANSVGTHTSLAVPADGRPVISHYNATTQSLRVTRCGNAACTAFNLSTTVDDPTNDVGRNSSIAIGTDGLPVISHSDSTAHALRVTKCGNTACTTGNVSTTVDDPANAVGGFTSIAIGADGLPVISHRDLTAAALRVTKCGNAACTAGNVSTNVDQSATGAGYDTSIAIGADGLPVISHVGSGLRVTKCGNAACTAGNVSTTLASGGGDTSIAIGTDRLPVISHRFGRLLVTKCGAQSCQ